MSSHSLGTLIHTVPNSTLGTELSTDIVLHFLIIIDRMQFQEPQWAQEKNGS